MTVHIGDTGREVALLNLAEKGAYYAIRSLLAGAGGFVADEPDRIRKAIGADVEEWKHIWPRIEHLFPVAEGKRYHWGTLEDIEYRQAKRDAGKKGGQTPHQAQRDRACASPPPGDSRANVEQTTQQTTQQTTEQTTEQTSSKSQANVEPPSPSPSPSPDPSTERTPTPGDTSPAAVATGRAHTRRSLAYSALFEQVWSLYPRREDKAEAFREWQASARGQDGGEARLAALVRDALGWQVPTWKQGDPEFPRHALYFSRYLKHRRWEDERLPSGGARLEPSFSALRRSSAPVVTPKTSPEQRGYPPPNEQVANAVGQLVASLASSKGGATLSDALPVHSPTENRPNAAP